MVVIGILLILYFCSIHQVSVAFIMAHSTAILVNITLDGDNYREWAFCVKTALLGHDLLFHLTNDPPAATTNNSNASEIKTWNINDGKAITTIVNSVKEYIIMSLSSFKTTHSSPSAPPSMADSLRDEQPNQTEGTHASSDM
jgi:hypothetical protein